MNSTNYRFSRHVPTVALILVSLAAYLGMVWLNEARGTLRAGQTPVTIVFYGIAFAAYILTLVWANRTSSLSLAWIWVPAILFRLILLLTHPTLSDDVYRYLWDGHVISQGINPYAFAIDAPEFDPIALPIRALANHTWMASPYLPAAQGMFAAVTRLLPLQPLSMQIVVVIIDLFNGLLIARLLQLAVLPGRHLFIYLWNPLVVLEVAHGAHIDAYMILLMLLSLWLTLSVKSDSAVTRSEKLKLLMSPLFLALATLTKLLPILLLPMLFWRWRWRYLFIYFATVVVVLLPFGLFAGWGLFGELDGRGVFGALRIYGDQWQFNSGVFHWAEQAITSAGLSSADLLAKMMVGSMLLVVLAAIWWAARRQSHSRGALRLMAVPFMAYVLLTPTLHPWYLLIVIAFLPFLAPGSEEKSGRWWLLAPWLYLSAAVIFSYITYINPQDLREYEWVRALEWLPALLLLAIASAWWWHAERSKI
ncbi:MAG: hypothetical protein GY759_23255 [Chloroflexi bacterium]|nr:hypothetical protein [Chloroflexota bacterium]